VTFQDGDCIDPIFVKTNEKIIYSSNTDKLKENPLLFEKSIKSPEAKLAAAADSMELYLSDKSGAEIRRLSNRKNFDGHPWQRTDKPSSFIYSAKQGNQVEAWQMNIDQSAEIPLLKKKNISIFSLRPSPAVKKWAWIERNNEQSSQLISSLGQSPGGKEQKLALPEGDYRDLSWLNEDQIIFSAKLTLEGKPQKYYQLYSYDLVKQCLTKVFESESNIISPQYLKKHQTLLFVSDLSKSWQIYNKALPSSLSSSERQCLATN
jgi:Tol biopolymer transport system component